MRTRGVALQKVLSEVEKLHIGVDETGWIHTSALTDGQTQDPTVVPQLLASVAARTNDALRQAIAHAIEQVTASDARAWFKHARVVASY